MVSNYRPVRETITQIVNAAIKPAAKVSGFRKKSLNFFRRRGDLVQVVNVQLSRYNFADTGGFFVNIGIAFDQLCYLDNQPVIEEPREYDCQFRRRIRAFYPDAPVDEWKIDPSTDIEQITKRLHEGFQVVVSQLDGIDSIPSILSANYWSPGADYGLLARLHYVIGDMTAAYQYLQLESDFFADRRGRSIPELINRYHLTKLSM